jgi:hypothetical protein
MTLEVDTQEAKNTATAKNTAATSVDRRLWLVSIVGRAA